MFTLNCNGRLLVIERPVVMGIINVTPDSFFEKSRLQDLAAIQQLAAAMIREGASIIDIGGQSTRPGSEQVGEDSELQRVIPAIHAILKILPDAIISIDTYYARVAREAVAAGAAMINDISGGRIDPDMIPSVAGLKVPYVLMHMKGTPATMQKSPTYQDVTLEVLDFFAERISVLQEKGIRDIIIDPGFGFGKTISHNFELLRKLQLFGIIQRPIMVGISRKSTIYKTLDTTPENALNGTTVLNTIALTGGASILRVHDVKEAVEAVKLVAAVRHTSA